METNDIQHSSEMKKQSEEINPDDTREEEDTLSEEHIILEHESGLRSMIADAHGLPYRAFRSLHEAKESPDSVAVFEGDYGGQIYVVARVSAISCSEQVLVSLLSELDSLEWRDPEGMGLYFEEAEIGQPIAGGMGGGRVTEGIWVHSRMQQYASLVEEVLAGKRSSLFDA